jgi:hypothetical protein
LGAALRWRARGGDRFKPVRQAVGKLVFELVPILGCLWIEAARDFSVDAQGNVGVQIATIGIEPWMGSAEFVGEPLGIEGQRRGLLWPSLLLRSLLLARLEAEGVLRCLLACWLATGVLERCLNLALLGIDLEALECELVAAVEGGGSCGAIVGLHGVEDLALDLFVFAVDLGKFCVQRGHAVPQAFLGDAGKLDLALADTGAQGLHFVRHGLKLALKTAVLRDGLFLALATAGATELGARKRLAVGARFDQRALRDILLGERLILLEIAILLAWLGLRGLLGSGGGKGLWVAALAGLVDLHDLEPLFLRLLAGSAQRWLAERR